MIHTNEKVIKHKVGLLNLAEELGNVSKACKMMGLSRDTFYRYKAAADEGGVQALFDHNRRSPNLKNRVDSAVESVVLEYALEEPAHGQTRTSNELRKRGTFVSPSGVRSIWLRHGLACFKDRLKALSDKVAAEGLILTESQVAAMERKKDDDVACGEIETAHPGYLGSQDTYYVGTFKGIGRVYQQTFVDTYRKLAHAKLVTGQSDLIISGSDSKVMTSAASLGIVSCHTVIVQTRKNSGINSLQDLQGKAIGYVTSGIFQKKYAGKFSEQVEQVASSQSLFNMLVRGRIDGFLITDMVLAAYIKYGIPIADLSIDWRNSLGKVVEIEQLETHLRISNKSQSKHLVPTLKNAISVGYKEGKFAQIHKNYGLISGGRCKN